MSKRIITRRFALVSAAAGAASLPFAAFGRSTLLGYAFSGPAADRALGLVPPLACTRATRGRTEGPYYTPQTPLRADLREPDTSGQPLVLQGMLLTPDCRPVADAVTDIWHSDEDGRYDNSGFRYRGHQFTDASARFDSRLSGRFATQGVRRTSTSRSRVRPRASSPASSSFPICRTRTPKTESFAKISCST